MQEKKKVTHTIDLLYVPLLTSDPHYLLNPLETSHGRNTGIWWHGYTFCDVRTPSSIWSTNYFFFFCWFSIPKEDHTTSEIRRRQKVRVTVKFLQELGSIRRTYTRHPNDSTTFWWSTWITSLSPNSGSTNVSKTPFKWVYTPFVRFSVKFINKTLFL